MKNKNKSLSRRDNPRCKTTTERSACDDSSTQNDIEHANDIFLNFCFTVAFVRLTARPFSQHVETFDVTRHKMDDIIIITSMGLHKHFICVLCIYCVSRLSGN